MYNYLAGFDEYEHSTFRDYKEMEFYSLAVEGYVIDIKIATYGDDNFSLSSQVKPRTREKDPISKLPFYNVWVILCATDSNRVHVFSVLIPHVTIAFFPCTPMLRHDADLEYDLNGSFH